MSQNKNFLDEDGLNTLITQTQARFAMLRKGLPGGVAELNSSGKIPITQESADDTLSTSSTNPIQNGAVTTEFNNVKQALSNEVVTRAKLGAHNLFDGYFRNGLLTKNENYTNNVLDRNEALPNSVGAASIYFIFGAYLPAGSYVISVNGSDYVSINRVAIAGTNCVGLTVHLRPSYAFTSAVEGWNYFSIERDAGESDYSDIDFEGHDLKIMITLATDSDTTFRPYVPTNSQLLSYKDNGVLGAKNLLPNHIISQTGTSLTIIRNEDGSVTFSGTPSSDVWLPVSLIGEVKEGNYILSGCPSGGSENTYALVTRNSNNDLVYETGGSITGILPKSTSQVSIFVRANTVISTPITFYPMLRLASDSDPTYQPYAMTNKELTDNKAEKSDLASISITGTINNTGSAIAVGTYFYLNGTLVKAKTSIANNAALTLNTNYEVVTAGALNELIVFNNRANVNSSSLENYTRAGIFQVYAEDVLAEGWGILIVTADTNIITQTLINGVGIAFRKYSANQSAWSTWTKTLFS